jgi:hypothetical protein
MVPGCLFAYFRLAQHRDGTLRYKKQRFRSSMSGQVAYM